MPECDKRSDCPLFDPIVDETSLHSSFKAIRAASGRYPGREMLADVFCDFKDKDGNFIEQFQSTGFDTRIFELYLFAYFSRSGFTLANEHSRPDFLVSRGGLEVAVEATTTGVSNSTELPRRGDGDLPPHEPEHFENEMPIRLGSPLFSKLKKRYWELEHVRGKPLVLAIECFHDKFAQLVSDAPLVRYLYGLTPAAEFTQTGSLAISSEAVAEHAMGRKQIPSNLFQQPDAEHISAVLFTNSGTISKFSRMGYQSGYGTDEYEIFRRGQAYDPRPDAMDPAYFHYDMDYPPFVEAWGDGLVVVHNPRATIPVPRQFFPNAAQTYLESDRVVTDYPRSLNAVMSFTNTLYRGKAAKAELLRVTLPKPPVLVHSISKQAFRALLDFVPSEDELKQDGWFTDETASFLGVVLRDVVKEKWAFMILARDHHHRFRPVFDGVDFDSRHDCRFQLQHHIHGLLRKPQRLFQFGRDACDPRKTPATTGDLQDG